MAVKKDQKGKEEPPAPHVLAMRAIAKEFGEGSIMLLGTRGALPCKAFSTGAVSLDLATGIGGFPRGRIVEIYGPESSGKTTVCSHVVANAQKEGGICAFIDTEHALDPVYMKRIGVDIDKLVVSQPDCGEDALNIAEKLVQSNAFAVVVIDSVAALVPRAEIEGQMGDSHVGLHARLMSQALRKLTSAVAKSNTCLIFTNQIRLKIGVMYGNPETTTGGNALKFYASLRLDIRKGESIKNEKGDIVGTETKVKVVKNKLAPPFRLAKFNIVYPYGIDTAGSVIDMAMDFGIVEKRGSWFSYGSDQLGQGRAQAIDTVKNDPKLFAEIEKLVVERAKSASGVIGDESIATAADEEGEIDDGAADAAAADEGSTPDPG
jgi:recombination protein RecA